MIAIATKIFLTVGGGVLGALLFSIGLLVILNMEFKLFTGTIGYIRTIDDFFDNVIILFGNILGACLLVALSPVSAVSILIEKLSASLLLAFVRAIVCGGLIYSAVYCHKQGKDYMVVACVTGFILCGAEHCIADLCFAIATGVMSFEILLFLIIVTLGNSLGAIILDRITQKQYNK